MSTIAQRKREGLTYYASGQFAQALAHYHAILSAYPLEYEARLRVADCLAALGHPEPAIAAYRATAWYSLKAGHPLVALVAAKVLESMEVDASDVLTGLVMHYGSESGLIGSFAARLRLPEGTSPVTSPDLRAPVESLVAAAIATAQHCTAEFDEFPEALHGIPLLSALSEESLRKVLKTVVVKRMADGQIAIREGDSASSFFMVASGTLRVFVNEGDTQRELARLGEHAVFGEMALLSNRPRTASVSVVGEADLIELTRESLASLAGEIEQIASALHAFTRERLLANVMARSPIFRPFSANQQHTLLKRFTEHDVAAGTDVIREGDDGHGLFIVLSGELEVSREDTVLATLQTGDVAGEMAVVRDGKTSATVRAVIPSVVLFLERSIVDRMIDGVPEIRAYLESLTENREIDTRLTLGHDNGDDGSIDILF